MVNMEQKDTMIVGGIKLSTALKFDTNFREKSPVIAEVVNGNQHLKKRDIIICHHNHFYEPSPYYLQDDLYSIPFNHTILAKVNKNGTLSAVCGNVLGERIPIKTDLDLPPEFQKKYIDRILLKDNGGTNYRNGRIILTRSSAPYDIVYNWGGVEKRVTKVNSDMIIGVLI